MIISSLISKINKRVRERAEKMKIKGTVTLMKKSTLGLTDFVPSVLDRVQDLLGQGVTFQLVSSTHGDPNKLGRGKVGKEAELEEGITSVTSLAAGESKFSVTFEWEESDGFPGAIIVTNNHHSEFFLRSVSIEYFPRKGRLHFDCNSWIYPAKCYQYDRIFFTNDSYLPSETPERLLLYRKEELLHLRGDYVNGELKEHDRVYGYAFYNDLGAPEKGPEHARPVLGGSQELPYPRRGRTSRPPNSADPDSESEIGIGEAVLFHKFVYVPRDEKFGHLKASDFGVYILKGVAELLVPLFKAVFDETPMEFDTFQDVIDMFEGGIRIPQIPLLEELRKQIPFEVIREILRTDDEQLFRLPMPQVIKNDKHVWRTDEEFAREMLAGVNPIIISLLQEFPPTSKLDPKLYGNQNSTITVAHIQENLEGFSVEEALDNNRLFIMDHHDVLMPYLNRINSSPGISVYASRTLLFLKHDGTLKPLAIELSRPDPRGEEYGAVSSVYTPATYGVESAVWQLAKAYAAVNDSGVHQLVSHWLNTHAVMEPFVIATNRQLSVMHPIHKLLKPHFKDTMQINALARQSLINANGIFELTVFPGKYALQMSAVVYRNWKFTEQALPADLLKRGVAVEDSTQPNNIRLLIEDYPYAVDGLAIWSAIETWVHDYCSIYYSDDAAVQADEELQEWWKEIREVGHGDKKHEPWWPIMHDISTLVHTCTTIIWIASALHAAVNFGQFPYAGYLPNRPTVSRQFMPEPGTKEYEELKKNPDKVYLKTITRQDLTFMGVALIEVLSRHASDEVYLGQRGSAEWTNDQKALHFFEKFGDKLIEIEDRILEMNQDPRLKNRIGPVQMPYTLLYPNTSDHSGVGGLTGRGVPNSISI